MGLIQCKQRGNAFKGKEPVEAVAAVIFQGLPGDPYQYQGDDNKKNKIHKGSESGWGFKIYRRASLQRR
jgi:hypothetical protein